ncbi:MAG: cytochrome ubiquinol oxidase subunit I [Marinifilaceae bacterium]
MIEDVLSNTVVQWSRWQFAMTAAYHYMFVPLTLGLSFMIAIMETMWYRTRNQEWLTATKFWMRLFAINFAIGVATGLILEFQFGSNWSNYSWFVGDIFGAPLAIEGIFAFFLESTFVAVMFFGWHKVSARFHLTSTWMVFVGANLSALWILVANAWMQNPVGMDFNALSARNEMIDFWAVISSPTAINKFLHTTLSAYTLSACFVVGVASWFLIKNRSVELARKSLRIAAIFGIVSLVLTMWTGDTTGQDVSRTQPMKFAAMEGLNKGETGASLTIFGLLQQNSNLPDERMREHKPIIAVPKALSMLAYRDVNAFIPGIQDIIDGYTSHEGIVYPPVSERMANGRTAINALREYKEAIAENKQLVADSALVTFKANYGDFGYGYLESPYELIPPLGWVYYSFRIMVGLGMLFLALFILVLWWERKANFNYFKFIPYLAFLCVPLAYVASQCGWIVAEVGRQPWVIQDLMLTKVGATVIESSMVITTFWLFAVLFTVLLVAELKIMFTQIKKGF